MNKGIFALGLLLFCLQLFAAPNGNAEKSTGSLVKSEDPHPSQGESKPSYTLESVKPDTEREPIQEELENKHVRDIHTRPY